VKDKRLLLLALAVTAGCGVAGVLLLTWPAAPQGRVQPANARLMTNLAEARNSAPQSEASVSPADQPNAAAKSPPPAKSTKTAPAQQTSPQPAPAQVRPTPGQGDPQPMDALARVALSFVGTDREAEAYWIEAINDPILSADERQNLIEDLNEDGLSDPKHPSAADLPLILNRIALIEALEDGAMDEVNADAFREAHKDLVNLANLATGRGEPVK
jgi:hypothetical protein